MKNIRELRQRLRKGTPCFGTFLAEMNSSGVVATLANCGFDFFMIDLEHGNVCCGAIPEFFVVPAGYNDSIFMVVLRFFIDVRK